MSDMRRSTLFTEVDMNAIEKNVNGVAYFSSLEIKKGPSKCLILNTIYVTTSTISGTKYFNKH